MLFSLENLCRQCVACRRNKRDTANTLRFEARQALNLLALREALLWRRYEPARSVCFFVQWPKLRAVFAADFRDRVVHLVLVSHLEQTWEPIFIQDSYACRKGKGVHKPVARLQPHKTLFRDPRGKGLTIGNLNSQFFSNVYLNALDRFASAS